MRLYCDPLWANGRRGNLRNISGPGWLIAASLLFCLMGNSAEAQFSGPALGASSPVNVPVTPTIDQTILYPSARDIRLGEGDLLAIHLYGAPDYAPPVRVSLDGSIQLPLIGAVRVEDLTIHQAENLIADRLKSAGMYRNPQVTIQLTESPNQSVTVTGEIHGIVPVPGEKRLFDVLAAVGGLPPTASHTVTINRPGVVQPIVVDLGTDPMLSKQANVPVFAKDTVIVSRVGAVYLLGAFRTQGAIPIQQNTPLTLMQVAAIGGGPGFEGKYNDLRIIRSAGLERKVVQVDIKKVINGKQPDPVLEADDIIFLPTDPMKAAIKSGGISTLMGIASILILAVRQ
ncbi:MAG TPA: polysaccharide biosynthesis/export family protein [Edaphobacter sp.]